MRAAALVLMAVLAACHAPPPGTLHRATAVQPDGSNPMPVVLGDQTGLVTAIEAVVDENFTWDIPAVTAVPNDPSAVIVAWGTGACDDDTAVAFRRDQDGFRIDVTVNSGFDLGCTAQLLNRRIMIRSSEPVPVESIAVFGGL